MICYVDAVIHHETNRGIVYDVHVFYPDRIRQYKDKTRAELPAPVARFMSTVNREYQEVLPDGKLHCKYRRISE